MGRKLTLRFDVEGVPSVIGFEQFVHRSGRNLVCVEVNGCQSLTEPPHLSVQVRANSAESTGDCPGFIGCKDVTVTVEAGGLGCSNLVAC